jgi:hypothetical protein
VGDSFTHGNEVDDCAAYPSQLEALTGLRVGNFGVGGYDVIQSVERYRGLVTQYKQVKFGILGILHEGGRRNLNSFRPALVNDPGEDFLFKPYYGEHGLVRLTIPGPVCKATFDKLAEQCLSHDYWSKPEFRFPYAISFLKALATPAFRFAFLQKINKLRGKGAYAYDFQNGLVLDSLRHAIREFVTLSEAHGICPIILFIPSDVRDRSNPRPLIEEMRRRFPQALILDFGDSRIDWSAYMRAIGCHPTAYGYGQIASFLAAKMRERCGASMPRTKSP